MKIDIVKVGYLKCNCYILDIDNKVIVIDPGDEYDKIKNSIRDRDVVGIMVTHSHFDHVGAIKELVKDYKVKVYDYSNLEEKDYNIEGFKFEVIKVPGHAFNSLTFYFRKDKVMFTGDFLFKGTIGRWDLPESNVDDMEKSIEKIKKYNDDIKIYPGHGDDSTLGIEKNNNPFFKN